MTIQVHESVWEGEIERLLDRLLEIVKVEPTWQQRRDMANEIAGFAAQIEEESDGYDYDD